MTTFGAEVVTHKLRVAKTARYATVGAAPADTARLWIVFHGYGSLAADFLIPFGRAALPDTRIVAPEGLSRFYTEMPRPDGGHLNSTGATWLTRDDREDDLCDALAMVHAVVAREHAAVCGGRGQRPALGVLGFSQGVAMSMRWLVESNQTPSLAPDPAVRAHVLWAGGLAHDVDDDALRERWSGVSVTCVAGRQDRFATDRSRDEITARVARINGAARLESFEGGHALDSQLLRTLLDEMPSE